MSSRLVPFLREDFEFTTPPSVVEWAEGSGLVIPRSMSPARSGPYRCAKQPTSRPILECWRPTSGVRLCANLAGAQVAKTFEGILGTAYRICHSPMPQLILGPSEDWLRLELSEKRLMALINENPFMARMKPVDGSRFRKMAMEMVGGTIAIEGANSPVATAGSTQGIVWIEEAAKIEHQSREDAPEAHPIKLAFERTKDFRGLEFHYLSFTANRTEALAYQYYESGSQTHFYVECPHCREWFPFEFELRKEGNVEANLLASQEEARPKDYRSLVWSAAALNADGMWREDVIRETTMYVCPHNGCEIKEEQRWPMVERFETKDHNLNASRHEKSFRRPSFYSPSTTFADMALEFLRRGDLFTTGLQNFYNSWLAKPWEMMDANVKEEAVLKLRDIADYRRGIIPHRPIGLALTADPGQAQTHWMVGAVMASGEIYVIDWGTVLSIEDLLTLPYGDKLSYPIAGTNERMRATAGLCDANDWRVRVYNMCAQSRGGWFPLVGSESRMGAWSKQAVKTHPGLDCYTYSDFALKTELYLNRIQLMRPPRVYLPRDATSDIIHGLSGQQRVRTPTGLKWKKLPADHLGDCLKEILLASLIWMASRGQGGGETKSENVAAEGAEG